MFIFKDRIPQLVVTHTIIVSTVDCLSFRLACYAHNDAWMIDGDRGELTPVAELLCIKHHYCSLELLFNAVEVDVAIELFVYNVGCIFILLFLFFLSCFTVYYCTKFMLNI